MAYIFNDRNSTFWHALIPELRAHIVPSSIAMICCQKGDSQRKREAHAPTCGVAGLLFLLQPGQNAFSGG